MKIIRTQFSQLKIKKCNKNICKYIVAFFTRNSPPLNLHVTYSKLQRCREKVGDKNLLVEHTLHRSTFQWNILKVKPETWDFWWDPTYESWDPPHRWDPGSERYKTRDKVRHKTRDPQYMLDPRPGSLKVQFSLKPGDYE